MYKLILATIALLIALPGNVASAQVSNCAKSMQKLPAGEIAFESDTGDFTAHAPEIVIISSDGTLKRRLTTAISGNKVVRDTQPTWSPDGKQLAFVSDRDGSADIYLMEADGTGQRPLITSTATETAPAWSPDGKQIAFVSDRSGQWEVYLQLLSPTGSAAQPEAKRLTTNGGNDPAWSPDSQQIAYRQNDAIRIVNVDGSNTRRLTADKGKYRNPAWSPDGKQLAITQLDGESGLYVVGVDGLDRQPLARYAKGPLAWSPDGRYIAYAIPGNGIVPTMNINLVDTTTGNSCRLTNRSGWNAHPAWSPRSR